MSTRRSNEGKVLDALIRRIEERDGVKRADMRDPEAERNPSPVDQVCTFNGVLHAFEHTEIERRLSDHTRDPSSAATWQDVRARLWSRIG